jgi:hypothetical protein
MTTKTLLKAQYIAQLQARYPFYTEGSRPLKLANEAADAALAGKMRLEGAAWEAALADCGLSKRVTLKELAALPA